MTTTDNSDIGEKLPDTVPIDGVSVPVGDLGTQALQSLRNQTVFLTHYRKARVRGIAAAFAGVHRDTVHDWEKRDYLGFRARLAIADEIFTNSLETRLVERATEPKSHPLFLLTALNANLPEKYRPNAVVGDDTAKELMTEWRRWMRDGKKTVKEKKGEGEDGGAEVTVAENVKRLMAEKRGGGRA